MKFFRFLSDDILLVVIVFLLAFIPLYPKLPLLDIAHTWVYIRFEDVLIAVSVIVFFIQLVRRKATINTPLTIPIVSFWIIGFISTIFAVLFIFPGLKDVFPNLAFFNYLRRIEYLCVFFIAFSAMRKKVFVIPVAFVSLVTVILVSLYGYGQRLFPDHFYAFLTMNEEFAKGTPLRLSPLARIPSTFGGHYDLAAYLVLLIPILGSFVFAWRNIFLKIIFFLSAAGGLVLLLMTASRVSFAVYLVTMVVMLILQKQKKFIIPVIVASIIILNFFQGISQRFGSTISQVDLVVDARTGKAVGITQDGSGNSMKPVVVEDKQSTGENLPQGTGYINFPSSSKQQTTTQVVYKRSTIKAGTESAQITNIQGDFVVKKVLAYDLSFTTRFQGEWPRAIEAFRRNMLLGSGYSSISLATDNNYLRILGEVGALGFAGFVLIFLALGIYVYRVLPDVDTKTTRSLVIGVLAGIVGLGLNAILIDVFEASKVAYILWMLIGVLVGLLHLYQTKKVNFVQDIRNVLLSPTAIVLYLLICAFGVYAMMLNNFFVGDDFTWLRGAADCKKIVGQTGLSQCEPFKTTLISYFTNSTGFFYRPGTKIYFYAMYALFWLNHGPYHVMSLLFHFINTSLLFVLARRLLKSKFFACIASLCFLVLSGNFESIFWISATGYLIASMFMMISILSFDFWREKKRWFYFVLSYLSAIVAPFFHEFGIVIPVIVVLYAQVLAQKSSLKERLFQWYNALYLLLVPLYIWLRFSAGSLGLSGDYSYRWSNLVSNIVGNLVGYFGLFLFGVQSLPLYTSLRVLARANSTTALLVILLGVVFGCFLAFSLLKKMQYVGRRLIGILGLFILVPLLPFLGLGNIAPRYLYPASFGMVVLLVVFIESLHIRLEKVQRGLGFGLIVVLFIGFVVFHVKELYRINNDWAHAGDITSGLLKNFNDQFQTANVTPVNPDFYFVNVPIRYGEAWVFPVGLPDAMWFTFQNENLTVHTDVPLEKSLDTADASSSARVFEFEKDGSVSEVFRSKVEVPLPTNK